MIHQLDLVHGSARCIGLPGGGDFNAASTYALALSRDGRTLWAISPGYRRVAGIDVRAHRLRSSFSFTAGPWNGNAAVAALSRDGRRIAVSDAVHIWLVEPARKRVVTERPHVTIALAFSSDGKKLWAIGERSRIVSLRP
jgi:hypothetical protein